MFTVGVLTGGTELSPLQLRAAFRQLGYSQVPPEAEPVPLDGCFKLWIFLLINRLKFLAPEQRTVLSEELVGGVTGLAEKIQARDQSAATPMVVIADSRYATWHDHTGWLNLVTGQTVKHPRDIPLETIAYNLAVLFQRNYAACEERQRSEERNNDHASHPA